MATFMDISLVGHFSAIFVFLLIFVVIYGFLLVTNILKDKPGSKGLYAIVALAIAFLFSVSGDAMTLVSVMTSWFTVLIIFLFLIFFVVRMFVGDDDSFFSTLMSKNSVVWVMIIVFIIIFIISLSNVFGQRMLENQGSANTDVMVTDNQNLSQETTTTIYVDESGKEISRTVDSRATDTDDFSNNVLKTFVHPKVLGMFLLMLIGFFAIILIAKTPNP